MYMKMLYKLETVEIHFYTWIDDQGINIGQRIKSLHLK